MPIYDFASSIDGPSGRMHSFISLCARLILGAIFVYASIDKILHPDAFAKAVYNYQILPHAFINPTAMVLPWLELILGIFLSFWDYFARAAWDLSHFFCSFSWAPWHSISREAWIQTAVASAPAVGPPVATWGGTSSETRSSSCPHSICFSPLSREDGTGGTHD